MISNIVIYDRASIVLLIISLSLVQGSLLPKECTLQTGNRLQCNNVLPTTIPDGAEIVVLNDFPASVTITRYLFDGNGWNNITFYHQRTFVGHHTLWGELFCSINTPTRAQCSRNLD